MDAIYTAVFSVTTIGVICAAVLCVASKLMHVKTDERVAKLEESLPGVNCGACGYPGCSGYASALLADNSIASNLCSPGGPEVLSKISAILGVDAASIEKKTAVVRCSGDCDAQRKKMEYMGIQTCSAAKSLFSGESACAFGCLGYGDCRTICPSEAVCIDSNLARIMPHLCTGCGLCVKACPNKIISIENVAIPVYIACKNIEKGAVTRKKCDSGCIACGKCVRECTAGAIALTDNIAVIDYSKCSACGRCAEVCVVKCIKKIN